MNYLEEISNEELKIFMHCLAKFSSYYYETSDLYIHVLREYIRRFKD